VRGEGERRGSDQKSVAEIERGDESDKKGGE
jgi:hypothetical protein